MNLSRRCARIAGLFSSFVALAGLVLAQAGEEQDKERDDGKKGEGEQPEIQLHDLTGMQDDQQEMVRLFHEVERTLEAIDLELADAGAGRIPLPEGKDSGIERLLRSHGEKSDQAVSGIEKILELAQKMGGT